MNSFAWLSIAILAEVIATSALKTTEGFTRLVPSLVCVAGYCIAFYGLSIALRTISVGVAYAIWSGVGIVLVSLVGLIWFKQYLDFPAFIGIALILAGVMVINVFSNTVRP